MKHFTTVIIATRGTFNFPQSKPLQSVIYTYVITQPGLDLPDVYAFALGRCTLLGSCIYIR